MKSDLIRLGIRGFKPQFEGATASQALRTPESSPIPPNTLDEMRRDLTRLTLIREQIKAIDRTPWSVWRGRGRRGPNALVRLLASIPGVGIETADMLVQEVLAQSA